ncbi:phosphoribosyltransferase family protein [Haloechinothrix sp. LS1_15]|uniref:phosphoribosyltransferase n=1 Tax=Haloechinothrix sp. LS1_15 TaxID=2652248 RepID=UPI00294413FD|nr:phosphoribosyltransferase family protein [Haloechinothrix sp. LS1_15]MDV6012907.1 phosphoribosyltransferase [Haloechinothrix sp. LS1_15]
MRTRHRFTDRGEAGRLLGAALARQHWNDPVVLGLARGGVPVAAGVADALGAPLDVMVARKIGAPTQPELAIGAVTADGAYLYDPESITAFGLRPEQLEHRKDAEAAEARRRQAAYRQDAPPAIGGCDTVLVDDGLATGLTAIAAVRTLRRYEPLSVTVAVPVASPSARSRVAGEADVAYALHEPASFQAVGQWYRDFRQVEDAEVREILRERSGSGA